MKSEMNIKELIGVSKPKLVEAVDICGFQFGENEELEIVWFGDKPAIYLGEEGGYHTVLHLDSMEWEGKLCDGDFDTHVDRFGYNSETEGVFSVKDIMKYMK